ncbi:hypothetical protein P3S67_022232 [Capsicum chacoense]
MGMDVFQAENEFKVLNPDMRSSKIGPTGQARITRSADITGNIGYTPTSTSKLKWNSKTAISTKKLQEIKEKKRKKNVESSSNNPNIYFVDEYCLMVSMNDYVVPNGWYEW